jgi:hypothetical protein
MKAASMTYVTDRPRSENASKVLPQSLMRVSHQGIHSLWIERGKCVLGSLDGQSSAFLCGIVQRYQTRMITFKPAFRRRAQGAKNAFPVCSNICCAPLRSLPVVRRTPSHLEQ